MPVVLYTIMATGVGEAPLVVTSLHGESGSSMVLTMVSLNGTRIACSPHNPHRRLLGAQGTWRGFVLKGSVGGFIAVLLLALILLVVVILLIVSGIGV